MGTCICIAKSLLCSPETITTLLIDYTPIQNKKFKTNNKKNLYQKYIRKCLDGHNKREKYCYLCRDEETEPYLRIQIKQIERTTYDFVSDFKASLLLIHSIAGITAMLQVIK